MQPELLKALGVQDKNIMVGAICVYPSRVADVVKSLNGAQTSFVRFTVVCLVLAFLSYALDSNCWISLALI